MRIVLEMNQYACASLPRKDNEAAQTKGGRKWKDVGTTDIRGWLGICILMGCKKLPSIHHYWKCNEQFIHYELIFEVMTLGRWEQILRCFHLVDNNNVIRDVTDPRFDRIAKTR